MKIAMKSTEKTKINKISAEDIQLSVIKGQSKWLNGSEVAPKEVIYES